MDYVELTQYNVGQGLCTTVTGGEEGDLAYCGLFDCGTVQYNDYNPDIETVIINDILYIGRLDDIVISHQDEDHWSFLLNILLAYFGYTEIWKQHQYPQTMFCVPDCYCALLSFNVLEKKLTDVTVESNVIDFRKKVYINDIFCVVEYSIDSDNTVYKINGKCQYGIFCISLCQISEGLKYQFGDSFEDPYYESTYEADIACGIDLEELIEEIDSLCQYMIDDFMDVAIKNKFTLLERLKIKNGMKYIFRHLRETLQDYDSTIEKINQLSVRYKEKYSQIKPIRHIVFGGAYMPDEMTLLWEVIEKLAAYGMISECSRYESGSLWKFDLSSPFIQNTPDMCIENYHQDLMDLKDETTEMFHIQRNVTSAVVYMKALDNVRFLFPGDLTVHAFDMLHTLLSSEVSDPNVQASVMIAPHHGSDVTNFAWVDNHMPQPLWSLMSAYFPANQNVKIVMVSAFAQKFGHPGINFMILACDFCSYGSAAHEIGFATDNKYYFIMEQNTNRRLFCTQSSDRGIRLKFDGSDCEEEFMPFNEEEQNRVNTCKRVRTPCKRLFL